MKVLAILGSPRGARSQTRVLAEAVLAGAKEQGAEINVADLATVRLEFCTACEACHKGSQCSRNDAGCQILEQMLAADGIVLASPVYLNQVTAQLKTLLDRTSKFIHCLRLMDKYLAAVTTSGGGGGAEAQAFLRKYAVAAGAQFAGGVDASVQLQETDLAAARKLGVALAVSIRDQTCDPAQLFAIEEQKKRFGRIVGSHRDSWAYEYKFWQDKGWL